MFVHQGSLASGIDLISPQLIASRGATWPRPGYDIGDKMDFDHAAKKEDAVSSSRGGIFSQNRQHEEDRRDTVETVPDGEEAGPPDGMLPMPRTHAHYLGKLTFRAEEDDDPS